MSDLVDQLRERRIKEQYQRLKSEHPGLLDRCVMIATVIGHELTGPPERIARLPATVEMAIVSLVCRALDAAGDNP